MGGRSFVSLVSSLAVRWMEYCSRGWMRVVVAVQEAKCRRRTQSTLSVFVHDSSSCDARGTVTLRTPRYTQ